MMIEFIEVKALLTYVYKYRMPNGTAILYGFDTKQPYLNLLLAEAR